MTDQAWANPVHNTESADLPWSGLPFAEVELDPEAPTAAAPGSMEKVMMLQARYAAGVPLWDEHDGNDHSEAGVTQAVLGAASSLLRPSAGVADDVVEEQGEPLAI